MLQGVCKKITRPIKSPRQNKFTHVILVMGGLCCFFFNLLADLHPNLHSATTHTLNGERFLLLQVPTICYRWPAAEDKIVLSALACKVTFDPQLKGVCGMGFLD